MIRVSTELEKKEYFIHKGSHLVRKEIVTNKEVVVTWIHLDDKAEVTTELVEIEGDEKIALEIIYETEYSK